MALLAYRTLVREDGSPALTLTSGRIAKGGLVVRAEGVESKEAADALKGLRLFVPRSALPEPERGRVLPHRPDRARGPFARGRDAGQGSRRCTISGPATCWRSSPPGGGATWFLPFTVAAVPEVRIAEGILVADRPNEEG